MLELRLSGSDDEVDKFLAAVFASERYDVCSVSTRRPNRRGGGCRRYVNVIEAHVDDGKEAAVEEALSSAVGVKVGDVIRTVAETHPEWYFEFRPICSMRFESLEDAPDPGEAPRLSRYSVGADGVTIGSFDLSSAFDGSASDLVAYFDSHGEWEWDSCGEFAWGDCDISTPGVSVAVRRHCGSFIIAYECEEFIEGDFLSPGDCWEYIRTA